jgi:hypothetical protein
LSRERESSENSEFAELSDDERKAFAGNGHAMARLVAKAVSGRRHDVR